MHSQGGIVRWTDIKAAFAIILVLTGPGCGFLKDAVSFGREPEVIFHERSIFNPGEYGKECHSSTVTELPNGDLYAAWWCGTTEGATDTAIFGSRLVAGASSWQKASIIADREGSFDGNPVLSAPGNNILRLYFVTLDHTSGRVQIMARESFDLGSTWGPVAKLGTAPGMRTRNHLLSMKNGQILFPLHNDELSESIFLISDDGGTTWLTGGTIPPGLENAQPTVISREDGSLFTLMRSWDPDPAKRFLLQSTSYDYGRTWTAPVYSAVPTVSSAVEMIRLTNGHVVLAYNDGKGRERTPLTLAVSLDGGKTWTGKRNLESGKGSFSYPSLMQSQDGHIHITYSYDRQFIKHVEVNEAWIREEN